VLTEVLRIGPLEVGAYQAIYAVAIVAALTHSYLRMVRGGLAPGATRSALLLVTAAAIVGTRVVASGVDALAAAAGAAGGTGSLSTWFGAVLGGGLTGLLACRIWRWPLGTAFDLGTPPIALGQAIGRLGCLAAGCCQGKPNGGPLAMVLPDPSGVWCPRYPAQLLAAAGNLLIFGGLLLLERRRGGLGRPVVFPGFLTLLFLGLYAIKRFALEFLRDDPPYVVGPLSWAHVASLALLAVVVGLAAANLAGRARGAAAVGAVSPDA
jgi:phosphatidylglycerol---prolipoprotein diacylglyceryl transferase